MKRFFAAVCSLSAILALSVSCEKESLNSAEETVGAGLKTVTLTVGMPDDSKINSTTSNPKNIKWNSSSESLGVIGKVGSDVKYYEFKHATLSGASSSAEFTCDAVDDGAELLYAIFPYAAYDQTENPWDGTSENIPLELLSSQSCAAAMGITGNALLASKISGSTITLKHVCGYIKLNIPERYKRWADASGSTTYPSSDLKSVKVSSTSAIAGEIGVAFNDDGSIKSVDTSAATKTEITSQTKKNTKSVYQSYGSHASDSESAWTPGVIYIPVIPGTYNDLDFTLSYRSNINGEAVDSYTAQSRGTNTFTSGKALGGTEGITLSGAFVESLTANTLTKSGSTLPFSGQAVIWTYSGITASDYSFSFCYREAASGNDWTEIAATYDAGNVTASATVDEGKSYEAKMKIVAGGVTYESAVVYEGVVYSVTFDIAGGDYGSFAYYTDGAESGYHKFVNSNGEDIFPNHSVKSTDVSKYYIKEWDGSAFGEKTTPTTFAKTLGMTLTKNGYQAVIEHCSGYYTVTNGVWCPQKVFIRLVCPSGKKITKVLAEVDAVKSGSSTTDRPMEVAIGTANGDKSVVATSSVTAYSINSTKASDDSEKGKDKSILMEIPSPTADNDLWLYVNNRCTRFTVYYED